MARHHHWFERETTLRGRWGEPDDMFAPEVRRALRTPQPSPPRLPGAMMAGLFLHQRDLSGADFSAADLSGADLALVQLVGADLRGADLRGARLYRVRFDDADLRGADLAGARIDSSSFLRARLDGACFDGADLRKTRFDGNRVEVLLEEAGEIARGLLIQAAVWVLIIACVIAFFTAVASASRTGP